MKIPVIKKIVEQYTLEELQAAEAAMLEEQTPAIEIEGHDEGEKLTHVLAAVWVKNEMNTNGTEAMVAIRNYAQRVRNSIS
ncbi:MAG: hypothetical protein M0D57_03400 [Sphingobacteriales bacterium JAD_PAG50586_3]|nr:MAG: hypothetical protein M0D57_03400 [Sphingobacteriales bacterium JAD_PAG50586_3]